MRHLPAIAAIATVFTLASCISTRVANGPTPSEIKLVDLMAERLDLAHQIAWQKYLAGIPIAAPEREAELLDLLDARARESGLPSARSFFEAQIAASRNLQAHVSRRWRRGDRLPPFPPKTIVPRLRDEITAVSVEMIPVLASVSAGPSLEAYAFSSLRKRGIPWLIAWSAVQPLGKQN